MIAFSFWSFHIYWYGIFYVVAFLLSYYFLTRVGKKKYLKIFPHVQALLEKDVADLIIACALWVLIWWRLGHIFIYDFTYYLYNPLKVFALWQGGMSFIWGGLWVLVAMLILRYIKKIPRREFFVLCDILVVIVPLGIMMGRLGNFLNQELYGTVVPSGFWGMGYGWFSLLRDLQIFHVYPKIDQFLRINTNMLAGLFEGFLLLITMFLLFFKKIKKPSKLWNPGFFVGFFLLWYSAVRFVLEYLREDSQFEFIWSFTKSQRFFIVFFLVWVGVFVRSLKRKT